MRLLFLFLPLFLATLPLLSSVAQGTVSPSREQCQTCHQDIINKTMLKSFIHSPFLEGNCEVCHCFPKEGNGPDAEPARVETEPATRIETSSPDSPPSPVTWLKASEYSATRHTFVLDRDTYFAELVIDAKAPGRKSLRESVRVPPSADIPILTDDGNPPEISQVEVSEVRQGVLIEALITWRTDKETKSSVRYGRNGQTMSVINSDKYARNHTVTLPGLKKNTKYTFSVTAEDFYGNRAMSAIHKLNTSRFFNHSPQPPPAEHISPGPIELESHFARTSTGNLIIEIEANQPVLFAIGRQEGQGGRFVEMTDNGSPDTAGAKSSHAPLKGKEYSSLIVCYTCHPSIEGTSSHPVNVRPKRGTVIPPEFTTLADGRITCMSCHDIHGSNREFRLSKSSRKKLCQGCHPHKF